MGVPLTRETLEHSTLIEKEFVSYFYTSSCAAGNYATSADVTVVVLV